jgi:4-amino-4-deoxy-L-arabinose transferase-like glycosyltransferase
VAESQIPAEAKPVAAAEGSRLGRLVKDWRFHLWALVAIALVPRAIYLAQIYHWPFFYYPILDSRTQNAWAEILLQTLGIGNNEVMAKPPLYAYFLVMAKLAVGTGEPSLFAARLLQLVMGAVTCGLTYVIGRRVFGTAMGLAGGLLLAFYGPGIFGEGELLDTALATLLATGFLLALLGSLDRPSGARWFGTGLLLGLLGLTRGNLLLLAVPGLALLAAWLRASLPREELRRLELVFVAGVVLPIIPITMRNAIITGTLIPISNNGGINFYTGNNPQADGYSPIPSGMAWERTWYEQMAAGARNYQQQDRYWLGRGLAFWRKEPGQALALLAKKAYLYWASYEIPNNLSYDWGRAHSSLLRAMPFSFAIIGPLSLLGIALGGWRSRGAWTLTLFVATQMVAVIAFFVCGRYRMTAVPALCLLAGVGAAELVRLAQRQRWGGMGLSLVALAGFAALLNADLYGVARAHGANRDWLYLGQSYSQQQRFPEARAAFERAAEADPRDADAWFFVGNAAEQAGDAAGAAQAFRQALKLAPDFATAAARLGDLALEHRWPLEEPQRLLERALQDQPTNVAALASLLRIDLKRKQNREAQVDLRKMLEAFSRWNRSDTRYPSTQLMVQQAAAEAQAAGVTVPGGQPGSRMQVGE